VLADISSGNRVTKAAIRRLLRGIEPAPVKRRRSGRKAGISPQKLNNKPKRDPVSFWKSLGQSRARGDVPRSRVVIEVASRPVAVQREVLRAYDRIITPPPKTPANQRSPSQARAAQDYLRANGVDKGWMSATISDDDFALFQRLRAEEARK
jgi:hypothetical protein